MDLKAAVTVFESIQNNFPEFTACIIHGKLKKEERQEIMSRFLKNEIQVLLATTVIEVGIDIPNATVMIIENSERMGLSQLHQLRGRVGRGNKKSSCILIYKSGLTELAKTRINILRKCNNGFDIAREDLDIRGPGEILGRKQKGDINFKIV